MNEISPSITVPSCYFDGQFVLKFNIIGIKTPNLADTGLGCRNCPNSNYCARRIVATEPPTMSAQLHHEDINSLFDLLRLATCFGFASAQMKLEVARVIHYISKSKSPKISIK